MYDKYELLKLLRNLIQQDPAFKGLVYYNTHRPPNYPHSHTFIYKFGSWSKAVKLAETLTSTPDVWQSIAEYSEVVKEYQGASDTLEFPLPENSIIVFTADWHLGCLYSDVNEIKKLIETICDYENVYLITVGDLVEGIAVKSRSQTADQVVPLLTQYSFIVQNLEKLTEQGKYLCGCWGNHDHEFIEKLAGISPLALLFLTRGIPYFRGKGKIKILCSSGDFYTIWITHKSRFNSFLNIFHSCLRETQLFCPEADIVCIAHHHIWGIASLYYAGKKRVWLRVGSYKNDDTYSVRYYYQSQICSPCVIVGENLLAFENLSDALKYRGDG